MGTSQGDQPVATICTSVGASLKRVYTRSWSSKKWPKNQVTPAVLKDHCLIMDMHEKAQMGDLALDLALTEEPPWAHY